MREIFTNKSDFKGCYQSFHRPETSQVCVMGLNAAYLFASSNRKVMLNKRHTFVTPNKNNLTEGKIMHV